MQTHRRTRLGRRTLITISLLLTCWGVLLPHTASASNLDDEARMLQLTNQTRAAVGLAPLAWSESAANVARGWSASMAGSQTLAHNPNLVAQISSTVTNDWTRIGENVGYGPQTDTLQAAFVASAAHYANIVGAYNEVGIGAARDSGGRLWITLDFVNDPTGASASAPPTSAPAPAPAPPPAPPTRWYLKNTLGTGIADSSFDFGQPGDIPIACDWNGDGVDTAGVYRDGAFYYANQNATPSPGAIARVPFGNPGDYPVCGDWAGLGYDQIGVFRNGWYYISVPGRGTVSFPFGSIGDLPVAGDWNGDGKATVGVFRNGTYFLTNVLGGVPFTVFGLGDPGDQPFAGDWKGTGSDTVGVFRNGTLFIKYANTTGFADLRLGLGDPGDRPIVGRWQGGRLDVLGVVRGT